MVFLTVDTMSNKIKKIAKDIGLDESSITLVSVRSPSNIIKTIITGPTAKLHEFAMKLEALNPTTDDSFSPVKTPIKHLLEDLTDKQYSKKYILRYSLGYYVNKNKDKYDSLTQNKKDVLTRMDILLKFSYYSELYPLIEKTLQKLEPEKTLTVPTVSYYQIGGVVYSFESDVTFTGFDTKQILYIADVLFKGIADCIKKGLCFMKDKSINFPTCNHGIPKEYLASYIDFKESDFVKFRLSPKNKAEFNTYDLYFYKRAPKAYIMLPRFEIGIYVAGNEENFKTLSAKHLKKSISLISPDNLYTILKN